jgi:hypothetical protein
VRGLATFSCERDRVEGLAGEARRVVSFDSVPANHGNIFDEPNV